MNNNNKLKSCSVKYKHTLILIKFNLIMNFNSNHILTNYILFLIDDKN